MAKRPNKIYKSKMYATRELEKFLTDAGFRKLRSTGHVTWAYPADVPFSGERLVFGARPSTDADRSTTRDIYNAIGRVEAWRKKNPVTSLAVKAAEHPQYLALRHTFAGAPSRYNAYLTPLAFADVPHDVLPSFIALTFGSLNGHAPFAAARERMTALPSTRWSTNPLDALESGGPSVLSLWRCVPTGGKMHAVEQAMYPANVDGSPWVARSQGTSYPPMWSTAAKVKANFASPLLPPKAIEVPPMNERTVLASDVPPIQWAASTTAPSCRFGLLRSITSDPGVHRIVLNDSIRKLLDLPMTTIVKASSKEEVETYLRTLTMQDVMMAYPGEKWLINAAASKMARKMAKVKDDELTQLRSESTTLQREVDTLCTDLAAEANRREESRVESQYTIDKLLTQVALLQTANAGYRNKPVDFTAAPVEAPVDGTLIEHDQAVKTLLDKLKAQLSGKATIPGVTVNIDTKALFKQLIYDGIAGLLDG